MKKVVRREIGIEATFEASPVGESKSLACINVQTQVLQGQIRTLRDAIEVKSNRRIHGSSAMVPWYIVPRAS